MKFNRLLMIVVTAGAASLAACEGDAAGPREVAHTESTKQGLMGGQKHTEDTVYQNPDGTLSRQRVETKVNP